MTKDIQIRPVAFQSKADAAYAELRERILSGEIAPSTALNQEQFAVMLGVSTTPLREALRRLETEGLVRTITPREMIVAPIDLDELIALYEVRTTLDPLAASLAADRHDADERDRMNAAFEALRVAAPEDATNRNRDFHAAIYRSSRNPVLIETLDQLWDRADRYRRLIRGVSSDPETFAEHEKLLKTVLDRDGKKAAALMREHLQRAGALIEESLRQGQAQVG